MATVIVRKIGEALRVGDDIKVTMVVIKGQNGRMQIDVTGASALRCRNQGQSGGTGVGGRVALDSDCGNRIRCEWQLGWLLGLFDRGSGDDVALGSRHVPPGREVNGTGY
ncbi:carbon storage regulator [Nocardia sp. SYP-A9097]|uniref:carbon storage regulator n=1 Tax=Nocardia sp. SYP-A9097 TaxID=2663237 RepID=UPI001891C469|nr:carbon storage regulator [Nocardia sp. SYP-A9097]